MNTLGLIFQGVDNEYEKLRCLKCAKGCDVCEDSAPCVITLNWVRGTVYTTYHLLGKLLSSLSLLQ